MRPAFPSCLVLISLTASCAVSLAPIDPTPVADAGPPVTCSASLPLGTVRWRTSISHDIDLYGPMAADAAGNTYFLHDSSLLGRPDANPVLIALDSCGAVRWRAPWHHLDNRSVLVFVALTGTHVLVLNGDLQSFDAATGAHEWTVGIPGADTSDSIRAMVVDSVGGIYVLSQAQRAVRVHRIDAASGGTPVLLLLLDNVSPNATATDLALDSQGNLVFPLTDTNVSPGTGVIHSMARDGTLRFATPLPNVGYQDHLTVGTDTILSGDTGTVLSLDGAVVRTLPVAFGGPGAVDSEQNVYLFDAVNSAGITLTSFDRAGGRRWTTMLSGSYAFEYGGGPLLGQQHGFYVFEKITITADGGTGLTQLLVALDLATGSAQRFEFPGHGSGHALLTGTDVVFVVAGDAVAVSTGGETPSAMATWPTPRGGNDQRGTPRGL